MTARFILLASIMAFLIGFSCGCASTSAIKTCANGDRWEVRSNRFLWQTEQVKVSVQTNGLTEVTVSNTRPDTEAITASAGAIGAIVGAAVQTATK